MKIERYIGVYQKSGQQFLIEKIYLPENSLEVLSTIFDLNKDDPLMYFEYDVDDVAAAELQRKFGVEFNLNKFDYAVSAESSMVED